MDIQTLPGDGHIVVKVSGDLELSNIKTLRGVLEKILTKDKKPLHLDLSDVDYMDSSGAAVLIEGFKWSKKTGAVFKIMAVSEPVRSSLELMRLLDVFGLQGS